MKDTSPEMERRFRAMLLARTGAERLKMGCEMHQCAQMLVRASVLAKHPQATPADLRRALLLRFYGQDFSPDRLRAVSSALEIDDQLPASTDPAVPCAPLDGGSGKRRR